MRLVASLAVLICVLAGPAAGKERAQLALDFAQALADNRERLRGYTWRTHLEVYQGGERQVLRYERCRYGADGQVERTVLAGSEEPGVQQAIETELGRGVRERLRVLVDGYAHPSAGSLVDFFEAASFEPVLEPYPGCVEIRGRGLLQPDDQVTLVADLAGGVLHSLRFTAKLDDTTYQVAVTYAQAAPEAPFHVDRLQVKAPGQLEGRLQISELKPSAAAAPAPDRSGDPADGAPDLGWPRVYESSRHGKLELHEPQLESWDDRRRLEAVAAVALTPAGESEPLFGAVRLQAHTTLQAPERTVLIERVEVTEASFPEQAERSDELLKLLNRLIPNERIPVSLERLQAGLDEGGPAAVEVASPVPAIVFAQRPTVLVTLDGEPELVETGVEGLFQVMNTEWLLFSQPQVSYTLLFQDGWLSAASLEGPWVAIPAPALLQALPDEPRWREVRARLPGKALDAAQVPAVAFATTPTELIVTDGEPRYTPIRGTDLLYVTNTEEDLFYHSRTKQHFVLLSGRWYRADELAGPWTACAGDLPRDFARIPSDHTMGRVLSAVPGTEEASEAVLMAQVPRRAQVKRDEAELEVTYSGEPEFEVIAGTDGVSFATNTVFDVFRVGERFYACHQAVWFEAPSPTGPWTLCTEIPVALYGIPASHPKHRVIYVGVDRWDDDYVYYSYTSGYLGVYTCGWGTVVYGTGFYYAYPPYWYRHYHWYYYPLYGGTAYHAYYGARVQIWGNSSYWYAPYGTYVRTSAWGTVNGRPVQVYREAAFGPYASWGRGVVSHSDGWAQWARRTTPTHSRVGVRTSGGGAAIVGSGPRGHSGVARAGNGDLYVGRDGNLFRRTDSGWQRRADGGWHDVTRATPSTRPQSARQRPARPTPARPTPGTLTREHRDYLDTLRRTRSQGANQRDRSWQRGNYAPPQRPSQPRTRYPTQPRARSFGGVRRGGLRGGGFRGGGFRGGGS